MEQNEKRMAGDYEIIQAVHIGDREIVLGENQADTNGQKYMCAYCRKNDILVFYDDCMGSDDYPEMVKMFGERIAEQAEKTRIELRTPVIQGINNTPLTVADCTPISYDDDINDRFIVIKQEVLRREYRSATHQIKLCTGGFGAYPNSRGSACYCVDLYSGDQARYERRDVLGTLTREQLPKWAEHGLQNYLQQQRQKKAKAKEDR